MGLSGSSKIRFACKCIELILACACIGLYANSMIYTDNVRLTLLPIIYGGYVMILVGLVLGYATNDQVPNKIDLLYTFAGLLLFIGAGSTGINYFRPQHPYNVAVPSVFYDNIHIPAQPPALSYNNAPIHTLSYNNVPLQALSYNNVPLQALSYNTVPIPTVYYNNVPIPVSLNNAHLPALSINAPIPSLSINAPVPSLSINNAHAPSVSLNHGHLPALSINAPVPSLSINHAHAHTPTSSLSNAAATLLNAPATLFNAAVSEVSSHNNAAHAEASLGVLPDASLTAAIGVPGESLNATIPGASLSVGLPSISLNDDAKSALNDSPIPAVSFNAAIPKVLFNNANIPSVTYNNAPVPVSWISSDRIPVSWNRNNDRIPVVVLNNAGIPKVLSNDATYMNNGLATGIVALVTAAVFLVDIIFAYKEASKSSSLSEEELA